VSINRYTGCCPGEHSSGDKRQVGCIDRMDGRVRALLVEAVWRFLKWQPGWKAARKTKVKLARRHGNEKENGYRPDAATGRGSVALAHRPQHNGSPEESAITLSKGAAREGVKRRRERARLVRKRRIDPNVDDRLGDAPVGGSPVP
jgi:hypothetical protein